MKEQKRKEKELKDLKKKMKEAKPHGVNLKKVAEDIEMAELDGVRTSDGKILRKKVLPKKKIIDEKGSEWELVEKKQTVLVEEEDD